MIDESEHLAASRESKPVSVNERAEVESKVPVWTPQQFLQRLQFLRSTLERDIGEDYLANRPDIFRPPGSFEKHYLWNPVKDFDYAGIAEFASITLDGWRASKQRNGEHGQFDGEAILGMLHILKRFDLSGTMIPDNTVRREFPTLFFRFRSAVEKFELKVLMQNSASKDTNSLRPTEADIDRVRTAIDGMLDKNASVAAVARAAKMRKAMVGAILKLIRSPVE